MNIYIHFKLFICNTTASTNSTSERSELQGLSILPNELTGLATRRPQGATVHSTFEPDITQSRQTWCKSPISDVRLEQSPPENPPTLPD